MKNTAISDDTTACKNLADRCKEYKEVIAEALHLEEQINAFTAALDRFNKALESINSKF